MVKLAANLTMLFQDMPFLDRIDAAAAAGFTAIECVEPYVASEGEIVARLDRHGLTFALFNMPPGNWSAGERGIGADPDRTAEFAESIATTLRYARALGTRTVHLMAGKIPVDADRQRWTATLIDNVRRANDVLGGEGITLVLEPINQIDIRSYFYSTSQQALEVIDAVGSPNVKLLYDIYHMQISEGDLARTIERLLPRIGHMQLADNPGRHEPGSGEINYPWLLQRIDELGYQGWIGCEYVPLGQTAAGLGWAKPYLN